jgi:apolipoprotein N-acyltransferase
MQDGTPASNHSCVVRALLVVAAVLLIWLALPPVGLAPLALVALAPFLVALEGLTPREALPYGFVYGFAAAAANSLWFLRVFPWYFAAPLWAIQAVPPTVFAIVHARAAKRGGVAFVVTSCAAWIAIDWFRSEVWHLRFAWFTLGHALGGSDVLRQNADLAGVYGLTLFAFATSFAIERAVWFSRRGNGPGGTGKTFVILLVTLATNLAFAARGNRVLGFAKDDESRSLKVLAVQDDRSVSASGEARIQSKRRATIAALASFSPDVIVWPEVSFLEDFERLGFKKPLAEIARAASATFVFGSMRDIPESKRKHNAAVVLAPSGEEVAEYWKRNPVQFVEDLCLPGTEPTVVEIAGVRCGLLICYDGTYSFVARDLVHAGAEALLVPTEDETEWGELQHRHHALFYPLRACEVRRPIVRAAASGITFALDAWGREIGRLPIFKPGTLPAVIHPNDTETPYSRGGWLLPHLMSVVAVLGVAFTVIKR